jgi:hypothetical protein
VHELPRNSPDFRRLRTGSTLSLPAGSEASFSQPATEGPLLARQEFAEERDIDVLGDAFGPRSTRRFAPHRATLRVSRPFG